MSAFLGKIHYWLYNKIQLHEVLINQIVLLAMDKGYNTKELLDKSYKSFGNPSVGELENEIEHSNIHGWLQERIISVEKRLAYVVTEFLKANTLNKDEITAIFKNNAQEIVKELDINDATPQDLFTLINNYMLDGMPCDRVNEVNENNSRKISWKTIMCLHKDYWNEVGGDVKNFYYFRDSWINGFIDETGFRYSRTEDTVSIIERE